MSDYLCDLPAYDIAQKGTERGGLSYGCPRVDPGTNRCSRGETSELISYQTNPEDLEKIHAYITVTRDRARSQADAIEKAVREVKTLDL